MSAPRAFRIRGEHDVAEVTRAARDAALALGLTTTEAVQLATAVSEVAANLVRHGGGGTVTVDARDEEVAVEARDTGPGIPDLELAMRDGYSTRGGLGLGLPGARRLVDEFAIDAAPGTGTRVRLVKRRSPAGERVRAPGELAEWAVVSPPGAGATAIVEGFRGGLLLAVAHRQAELLRARAAAPPAMLVDAVGGEDVAVVQLAAHDGHLTWQAAPGAAALLRRDRRGAAGPLILQAPRGRSATLGALRDDVVVVASFTPHAVGPASASARAVAEAVAAAGPADAVVVVARLRRGVLERPLPR